MWPDFMMKKFFTGCIALLVCACGIQSPRPSKPLVLVSLPPYQFLIEQIVGDQCSVKTVVPLGANPHTYEPSARQATEIASARMWFRIGEPFEKKMFLALQEKNEALRRVDLRDGIPLLGGGCSCHQEHAEDELDRHLWLSPKILEVQVGRITEALVKEFPEHKELFLNNAEQVIERLRALDKEIATQLAPLQHRSFLVAHPAFAYFCEDYGLHQISIEYDGKEPTPKHLQDVLQSIREEGASVALALPQHSSRAVKLVADTFALSVATIDPYASDPMATLRLLTEILAKQERAL